MDAMKNLELSEKLAEVADLLELTAANPFRIRAYRRASQTLANLGPDIASLTEAEIREIPGFGADLAGLAGEFVRTGRVGILEELKAELPPGLPELLAVPGLGPKKVQLFFRELGVDSLDKLKEAAESGQLQTLPGIREKTVQNLLAGIAEMATRSKAHRRPRTEAEPTAKKILARLRETPGTTAAEAAGSYRRGAATIGDLDILAVSDQPAELMNIFVAMPEVARVLGHGETKSSVHLIDGLQVDLRVVPAASFGAALQYFTGNKDHNIRLRDRAVRLGLKVNEYGVFRIKNDEKIAGDTEESVYAALGLRFIPPEQRLGGGELADFELKK